MRRKERNRGRRGVRRKERRGSEREGERQKKREKERFGVVLLIYCHSLKYLGRSWGKRGCPTSCHTRSAQVMLGTHRAPRVPLPGLASGGVPCTI